MDALAYLTQHKDLTLMISKDLDRVDALRSSLKSIPSPSVCPDPVQVSPRVEALYAERLVEIDELEAMIRIKEDLAARLESQIKAALNQMRLSRVKNAQDLADLLLYYFILHKEWDDVRFFLHIGQATVFRWRILALAAFPLPDDPIDIYQELSQLNAA